MRRCPRASTSRCRSARRRWAASPRPISSDNAEARQLFDQGFQLMYAFAKVDAARSFREAQKRDPDCAICYWGEAWTWGSYLNGPMRADEAPRAYAAIQKALALGAGPCQPARTGVHRRHGRALRRGFRSRAACRAGPRVRGGDARGGGALSGRSGRGHALRRGPVPAGAAAGDTGSERPECQAAARGAGTRARGRHPAPRRVSSVRARHGIDRPAREGRAVHRVPGQRHSGGEPHQPHAVAHLERDRPLGRLRAGEPPGLALRPEGRVRRGAGHLPLPQSAHAAVRRLHGRPGRHRDSGGQGLREADGRHDVSRADAPPLPAASTRSPP